MASAANPVILPDPAKRNVLITSALPYVNNVPHLGNIIGCVLSADVFARYCRLRGYNTLFICGTDEYGTATETKALKENTTPQAICDFYYKVHADIYDWFEIKFDKFGRTSTEEQTKITQDIFEKLRSHGYTFENSMDQLYCPTCSRFLADRFVEGVCPHCAYEDARGDQCDKCQKLLNPTELKNPRCTVSNTTPVLRSTRHIFLDLPQLYEPLSAWFGATAEKGDWSANSQQITKAWIRPDGLKPRCITRDLKWGTPVPIPGYEDKVFYVWFDACIGYISITATYTKEWQQWWKNPDNVQLYQFMGKDNVPFHTVIFPGSLIGTREKYTMLHTLSTTEFLNYEGTKFSKSRGVGVFGNDAKETGIPPEAWRYYLLVNRPETADSNFAWGDFADKVNAELRDSLGNFINRSLKFVAQNFDGKIPAHADKFNDSDEALIRGANDIIARYIALLEKVKIKDALREVMNLSFLGNKYIQDNKPWVLVKEDPARCATVVYVSANLVKTLAGLIEPFMPSLAEKILNQLRSPHDQIKDTFEFLLPVGHQIGTPEPLIAGIDLAKAKELQEKYGGKKSTTTTTPLQRGFLAEVRVGEIVGVEKHPQAEHLYVLKVDLGKETRTVVSALTAAYRDPNLLIRKRVLLLCNLKDAKFKGVVSQGMLLVAEHGTQTEILTVKELVPLGSLVLPEGLDQPLPEEGIDRLELADFQKLDLQVVEGMAVLDGNKKLLADRKFAVVAEGSILSGKIK